MTHVARRKYWLKSINIINDVMMVIDNIKFADIIMEYEYYFIIFKIKII